MWTSAQHIIATDSLDKAQCVCVCVCIGLCKKEGSPCGVYLQLSRCLKLLQCIHSKIVGACVILKRGFSPRRVFSAKKPHACLPSGVESNMMESENQNSSAYSSLTNSTNEISEAMTVVGSGGSSPVSDVMVRRPATRNNGTTSLEIRTIIDDYNATLKRATKEIKALTVEKKKLEKEYEQLLTINETLAADLEKTLR